MQDKWCHGPEWAQAGARGGHMPTADELQSAERAVVEQWRPFGEGMLATLRICSGDNVVRYYKILCRSLAADPDVFRGFYLNTVATAAGRSVGGNA